ncbi:MAG: type II toxin-antitoxin system VapC family toxin [Elusimicrobia bacterium]|nr:type II toxin-antitoxin system VapC family toxin [Elusimicrobiota bacterium]
MIAYLDSSVILRKILDSGGASSFLGSDVNLYTSELTRVEALRVLDRYRLEGKLNDFEMADKTQTLVKALQAFNLIVLSASILDRAAASFPTVIGTLDAIHLASALHLLEHEKRELLFATHDVRQGLAAQAVGLRSEGFVLPKA